MAYVWIDNELFLRHKGVEVFHVYHDNMVEDGPVEDDFATSVSARLHDAETFDVRDLEVKDAARAESGEEGVKAVLRDAIDAGLLTQEGVMKVRKKE